MYSSQCTFLETKVSDLMKDNAELLLNCSKEQAKNKELTNRIDSVSSSLEQQIREFAELKNNFIEIQEEKKKLVPTETHQELQRNHLLLREELSILKEQAFSLNTKLTALDTENSSKEERLSACLGVLSYLDKKYCRRARVVKD